MTELPVGSTITNCQPTVSISYQNVKQSHDNPIAKGVYETPEGYYQELNDYQVHLPPLSSQFQDHSRTTEASDDVDYHDSVEFDDLRIPTTVDIAPTEETRTKSCNCRNIFIIFSSLLLLIIMIVIISVLISHLVINNEKEDEQEKKLRVMETSLADEKLENSIQKIKHKNRLENIDQAVRLN